MATLRGRRRLPWATKSNVRAVIDYREGDADSPDEDAGLTPAQKAKAAQQLKDQLGDETTTDEEPPPKAELIQPTRHRSPKRQHDPAIVTWSSDEAAKPKRSSVAEAKRKRPQAADHPKSAKRSRSTKTSIVGRKVNPKKASDRRYKTVIERELVGSSEEDDEDKFAEQVPDYIKARRATFERTRRLLDVGGLKLPPSYDNVDDFPSFRPGMLQEKPDFPLGKTKKQAPYADVKLRYSLGVVPAPIAQWLRKYQVEGAEFLHELFVYQKGGILGDDMGLGKTIQVIAFLTAAFGKTGDERDAERMRKMRQDPTEPWYPRILVICPGSLMENWMSELGRWGWWHAEIFHGNEKMDTFKAIRSGRLEILITTYNTYQINKDDLNTIDWDCVVADECHQIKNRRSQICQAMNEINALCRIGLTGTAIQNNYDELWTLLNWTNPGKFGVISAWKSTISKPLQIGQSHDCTAAELKLARTTAVKLVKNLLPPFFLRRMKTLIADQLPKKKDRVVFCPLTEKQAEAYSNFIDTEIVDLIRRSTEQCDCGKPKKRGWCHYMYYYPDGDTDSGSRWQNHVFPCIATLQKLSNHLALLIPHSTEDQERQARDLENLMLVFPDEWRELYKQRDNIIKYADPEFCGKWKVLKRLLRFWHEAGDKVLVFSHSVRLLKMLQLLFRASTSYNVSYLDGAMSYADRAEAVASFNADPLQFVFLISTRAGGVGLNITSANKVVIVDPNWNPSYDLQAQDRAYRIGQVRDVDVFRLVSAGTIEEIVYARQIYKQQQANIGYSASKERRYFAGVQDQKDKKGEIFGLANLFGYHGENVVLREIVNKTEIAEARAGVSVVGLDMKSTQEDEDEDNALASLASASQHKDSSDRSFSGNNDDEDAAMSQLAAFIAEGESRNRERREESSKKAKKEDENPVGDPIQAILSVAGVTYTHENSEVVGSSRVETKLSKKVEENTADIMDFRHVFQNSSQDRRDRREPGRLDLDFDIEGDDDDDEARALESMQETKTVRYNPPEDVRLRQFRAIASRLGYEGRDGLTAFSLVVEGWSSKQRRECLERFYAAKDHKSKDDHAGGQLDG